MRLRNRYCREDVTAEGQPCESKVKNAKMLTVTLPQTGIGHLITDSGVDWLIAVHVPLAFLVFAVAGYLSVWAVRVRRQLASGHLEHAAKVGAIPNADVHDAVRPMTQTRGPRHPDEIKHEEQRPGRAPN